MRSSCAFSLLLLACGHPSRATPDAGTDSPQADAAVAPVDRPFFATAYVEEAQSAGAASDGDLWASCWGDDDNLYAANGDGYGFDLQNKAPADVVVNRIAGTPGNLSGIALAKAGAVSSIWTPTTNGIDYNRKPTGMVCVDGALYLAVQDLATDFMDAPAATIVKSTDHGATWTWDHSAPMFRDHVFTTIFFADFGKNNAHAIDDYVYAYGLDQNWRFSTRTPSPTTLYLARVPKASIQDRATWEFFTGLDGSGAPTWSTDIAQRKATLEDTTVIYQHPLDANSFGKNMTLLSQGSVVYDAPLGRYLYTSWTEYTFEFYEAPAPWGPWTKFLSKDYGVYPWFSYKNGGYATTIPSKFISADGRSMYVQSNTFVGGYSNYGFSLRRLLVAPYTTTTADNPTSDTPISTADAVPLDASAHYGNVQYLDDGVIGTQTEDSWNGDAKTVDYWGYARPELHTMNKVVYTTGKMYQDGGWFSSLRVQVRRDGTWSDVTNLTVTPPYPTDATAGSNQAYTMTFDATAADGVRIIGDPGGTAKFTSISELAALYAP